MKRSIKTIDVDLFFGMMRKKQVANLIQKKIETNCFEDTKRRRQGFLPSLITKD